MRSVKETTKCDYHTFGSTCNVSNFTSLFPFVLFIKVLKACTVFPPRISVNAGKVEGAWVVVVLVGGVGVVVVVVVVVVEVVVLAVVAAVVAIVVVEVELTVEVIFTVVAGVTAGDTVLWSTLA